MVYPSNINLNLNTKYVLPIPTAQQGDTARVLTFNILDNGVPFNLTGKTVRAKILKPDNTKCYNDLTITNATGGECDLKLTTQVLAVAGKVNCQLEIKEGEELLSTIIFPIDVEPSIDISGAAESTNEFTALQNGITKLDEWDKYFQETSGAIEEKYTTRLNAVESSLEENVQEVNKVKTDYAKKTEVSELTKDKATIKYVDDSVARLSSGTPLFASNTSEMTDTTKNYVNTTDGYLYIYNGEIWTKTDVQYQSTGIADNSVTYKKTNFMRENLNLYDPSLAVDGKFVIYNSGKLENYPTSATSGKINVGLGEWNLSIPQEESGLEKVIRCYGVDGRYLGISMQVSSAPVVEGIAVKTLTLNGRKQLRITITNPDIAFIETTIIYPYAEHNSSDFDRIRKSIQLQRGSNFTFFEKYVGKGVLDYECLPYELIEKLKEIENKIDNRVFFKIIKEDDILFLISNWSEIENLVQTLSINSKLAIAGKNNNLFNFGVIGTADKSIENPRISDISVKKSSSDDIAPPNINGVYIGANHGFSKVYNITCNNHNKTIQDIGSEWVDTVGTKFYIIKIVDVNTLQVISENKSEDKWDFREVEGNLTHSKNATNTSEIIITNKVASQWYPSIKNREINIKIDGVDIKDNGAYSGSELIIEESYYINDVSSTLDYFKSNVGKEIDISKALSINNVARIYNKYVFQPNGACVIEGKFEAVKDIDLGYIGFTQSIAPNYAESKLLQYIPNTVGVNGQNFSNIVDITTPSNINLTNKYWENTNVPPKRYCQIVEKNNLKTFGFTHGYIERNKNVSNALNIFTTNKNYPHYVDGGILKKNEIINAKCFRCPINYNLDRDATNISWFKDGGSIILMLDYHKSISKSLNLGLEFYNKNIEVLESKNFTLSNTIIDKTIDFSITNNYGYAVLKIV